AVPHLGGREAAGRDRRRWLLERHRQRNPGCLHRPDGRGMSGWKDLAALDASRLAVLTRTGAVSAEEAARACIERIGQRDAAVGAWAWLEPDAAIAQARRLDAGSARGPLFGVPVGVKDVFQTKDMPTEHNSPIYAGHRPGIDAACIDTLRAAGALILGKTTTVEFAGGFGRPASTRHPLDP